MSLAFTFDDIKQFLQLNGGKIEYHELVKHFKYALSDPYTQAEARLVFKDYVNTLATVSTEQNTKFIILRSQYRTMPNHNYHSSSSKFPTEQIDPNFVGLPSVNVNVNTNTNEKRRSHSVNYGYNNAPPMQLGHSFDSPQSYHQQQVYNEDYPPQPPPRRRSSSSGGTKVRLEEKFKPFHNDENIEKENYNSSPPLHQDKLKEIHELTFKSPGRVKEHAQKINKMTSELEFKPPMPVVNNGTINSSPNKMGIPKSRPQSTDDADSGSVQPLDPLRKKWILSASSCDFNELVSLLKEEPKLACYKDFTNGYTALHWAAKFGNVHIIKLIAGNYGVNPNIKSHGGFTPLHLAALSKQEKIMDLLIQHYNADPNIRDHSGKRPTQYLVNTSQAKTRNNNSSDSVQRKMIEHLGGGLSQVRSNESTSSFIRIGSMKAASKMKKLTGLGLKTWGSAESLTENHSKNSHSKKSRKKGIMSLYSTVNEHSKDSDSDSAYGFH